MFTVYLMNSKAMDTGKGRLLRYNCMEHNYIEKRYNIMGLSSIEAFSGIKGGMNGNCKDVYFIRMIGVSGTFVKDIANMDELQTKKMQLGQSIYSRIGTFPKNIGTDEIKIYTDCYEQWINSGRIRLFGKSLDDKYGMGEMISASCKKVLELYKKSNKQFNASIEKNFVVKILFWLDTLVFDYLKNWNPKQSMKFVAQEAVKEQEYLFCYLLTLLGIDVLLLQSEEDIDERLDNLKLSKKIVLGEKRAVALEKYDRQRYMGETQTSRSSRITISAPVKEPAVECGAICRRAAPEREERKDAPEVRSRGLTFEELALKASSVVMIAIHNQQGDVVGSGSGIMVGRNGYILTNHHVASGGVFYSVRIENDDAIYKTDEIIKYNSLLDLAIIRIDRILQPLPVYSGSRPLVRGQEVVAIGSPLGLFNSVSNGIISGFRTINDVDMIQFTAPISHGSSGGAVLNLQGEVIGVSTAGFDDGQNINLAVGYEFIRTFIRGFQ